jgi:hypothetical protein
MKELIEGEDYYFDQRGFLVLTGKYHQDRGYCCGYECLECPFDFQAVPEPRRSQLLARREKNKQGETGQSLG